MNLKNNISVIIIARNEAARIKACLDSVSWAEDVIVVDNGSTDETAKISKASGATIVTKNGMDFASLRDAGASIATGDWLLYVDADEEITPALRREILEKVNGQASAYYLSRINYYLGYPWPTKDKMVRLIKRSALISWKGALHEHADVKGEIQDLKESLIHRTHRTLSEMVEKTNEWSDIEANLRYTAGHPKLVPWRFLRVMCTAFYDSFIIQKGWKAGTVGWLESIYQAFSMFITYAKLWELQEKKK